MKARQIVGIVILVLGMFFMGPMVILPGYDFGQPGQGESVPWWILAFFYVPGGLLAVIGALTMGRRYWADAIGWFLVASALYGGLVAVFIASFMGSPEWRDAVAVTDPRQAEALDNMSFSLQTPLLLAGALALLGAPLAGLRWLRRDRGVEGPDGEEAVSEPARPTAVTVIAWFFIISAPLGALAWLIPGNQGMRAGLAFVADMTGVPASWWTAMTLASQALSLVCAIFLLRGANWARWTLLALALIGVLFNGAVFGQWAWALPGLIWCGVLGYFLFLRKNAVRWFQRDPGSGSVVA